MFKSKPGKQSSYHPNGKGLTDAIQPPKMTPIYHDCLHKATTSISKNHAMIVIEDLKVSNM